MKKTLLWENMIECANVENTARQIIIKGGTKYYKVILPDNLR